MADIMTVTNDETGIVNVTVKCENCPVMMNFNTTKEKWARWKGGELIQRVFPDLTPEQREMIISGTCPICWNKMFEENPE